MTYNITPAAASTELAGLRKLWLVISVASLAVTINIYQITQGGSVNFGVKTLIDLAFKPNTAEAVAAFWAIILLTVFVGAASYVAKYHAEQSEGAWHERYPMRIFDLPTGKGVGRFAHILALIVLTALPVWFLAHSWKVFHKHGVICVEANIPQGWRRHVDLKNSFFTMPAPPHWVVNGTAGSPAYRLASSERVSDSDQICRDMTDYFPPYQTWLMLAASLFALISFLWAMFAIFRPRNYVATVCDEDAETG